MSPTLTLLKTTLLIPRSLNAFGVVSYSVLQQLRLFRNALFAHAETDSKYST